MYRRTLISLFIGFIMVGCKSTDIDPKVSVIKQIIKNGSKVDKSEPRK